MEHLFKVTTKALGARIEKEFKENDIWQSSFSDVRVKLNECMRVCRGWKDRTTELTREFWRGQNEKHKWDGKPFFDPYLENMIIRINVIFELRSQHDELLACKWWWRYQSPGKMGESGDFYSFGSTSCRPTGNYEHDYIMEKWIRILRYHSSFQTRAVVS